MKKFGSYESATVYTEGGSKLPAGGYVLDIKNVRYNSGANGNSDSITIAFDIAEGEFAGYYQKQFDANTSEDKKWKGTVNVWVPKDDGSEKDGWTANRFRTVVAAIEESNSGYAWDWDEKKWKGKKLGGIFCEINTVIDGRQISYVGLVDKGIRSVPVIKSGKFKQLEPIFKGGASAKPTMATDPEGFLTVPDGAEDIPF